MSQGIALSVDLAQFKRALSEVEQRQVPFATALALNDTAADTVADFKVEMEGAFDRPTRWTLNAFFVLRASKAKLVATVERKTPQRGRHYLALQSTGGQRGQTGLEKLLTRTLPYAGHIGAVVPASAARLDRYGNWSGGQRNQVLSGLKAQRDKTANTTDRSAKRSRGRTTYFVPKPGHRLSPGVYARVGRGRRNVRKVLHFLAATPQYRQGVRFEATAERTVARRFGQHFLRRFRQAYATAK